MMKKFFRSYATVFALALGLIAAANAQTSPSVEAFPNVKIGNFGQMDERFYRGAQPEPGTYQGLKDLGITTVIDLRNDPTDYEKAEVEALGMKYVNISMSGWRYPKEKKLVEFLELMNNPETGKVFVHCKAGIHRTGVAGAVWRFTKYDWGYDQAYKEMKNYNFFSGLWHGALKDYVEDYAERIEKNKAQAKKDQAKLAVTAQTVGAMGTVQ